MKRFGVGASLVGGFLKLPRIGVAAISERLVGHEKVTVKSCW